MSDFAFVSIKGSSTLSSTADPHMKPIASSYANRTVSPDYTFRHTQLEGVLPLDRSMITSLKQLVRDVAHVLEPSESLCESEPFCFGQCVQELGGDGGGKEVQVGLGLGG